MKAPHKDSINQKVLELEEIFQEVGLHLTGKVFQDSDSKLTHPQFFTLKRLKAGPATVSEVAEYLGVSLSAVTSMADRLVKTGYICRKRSDHDRRLVWLELTPEGEKVFDETWDVRKKILHKFLGQLPDDDLLTLRRIYIYLLELIKNSDTGA